MKANTYYLQWNITIPKVNELYATKYRHEYYVLLIPVPRSYIVPADNRKICQHGTMQEVTRIRN